MAAKELIRSDSDVLFSREVFGKKIRNSVYVFTSGNIKCPTSIIQDMLCLAMYAGMLMVSALILAEAQTVPILKFTELNNLTFFKLFMS